MSDSMVVEIEGVGPVLMERSDRAQRVVISVRPRLGVRVAVPRGVSFKKAQKFVQEKSGWIGKHLGKIRRTERELQNKITTLDRKTAKLKLIHRIDALSTTHGFSYNKVTIRNQKTRWGSCSATNSISLNMQLAILPDGLMDYVILHELVHTRVKNHSKAFWAELDKYVGDGKKKDSQLKRYGLGFL